MNANDMNMVVYKVAEKANMAVDKVAPKLRQPIDSGGGGAWALDSDSLELSAQAFNGASKPPTAL